MIQKIFTVILPLLLPIFFYVLYVVITGKSKASEDENVVPLTKQKGFAPSLLLGVILMIIALIYVAMTSGTDPDQTYVPPKYIDGKIEAGHFENPQTPRD